MMNFKSMNYAEVKKFAAKLSVDEALGLMSIQALSLSDNDTEFDAQVEIFVGALYDSGNIATAHECEAFVSAYYQAKYPNMRTRR